MARAKKPQDLSSRTVNDKWRHVSVYLPTAMFAKIEQQAKTAHRSLSAEIIVMLEQLTGKKNS